MYIPKRPYLRLFSVTLSLFLTLVPSSLEAAKRDLQDIKIIAAEKLTYKDGFTKLEGAVQMMVDDLLISAPEVNVKDKEKAEFLRDVKVSSEKLNISAKHMEVDLETGLIKIFSGISEIGVPEKSPDIYRIDADLQTIDYKKGFFKAKSNDKQMTATHKDLTVNADEMQGEFKKETRNASKPDKNKKNTEDKTQLDKVVFLGSVIANKKLSQIKADKLFIFPESKIYRAMHNASFIYIEPDKEFRLKGDFLNLEELDNSKYVILASSNSRNGLINFTSPARKLAGRSKFARLYLENENATEVIFTGKCDIRVDNKRIEGEEVYLNNVTKELLSNLNRPKAIILQREKLTF